MSKRSRWTEEYGAMTLAREGRNETPFIPHWCFQKWVISVAINQSKTLYTFQIPRTRCSMVCLSEIVMIQSI
jgi:hypothetical protein